MQRNRVESQIFKIGLCNFIPLHPDHYLGIGQEVIPFLGQLCLVTQLLY